MIDDEDDPRLRPGYRPHRPPPEDPRTNPLPVEVWEQPAVVKPTVELMKNRMRPPRWGEPVEMLPGQPLLARRPAGDDEVVVFAVSLLRADYEHLLVMLKRVENATSLVERWKAVLGAAHESISRRPIG